MNRPLAVAGLVLAVFSVRAVERAPLPVPLHLPPVATGAGPVQRGRLVYARYGCSMCHGAEGRGGVSNPNAETAGVIPALTRVADGYTDDELRQLILRGTPTIGRANPKGARPPLRMPGWRDRMTDAEARDLVAYLMALAPKTADEKWH